MFWPKHILSVLLVAAQAASQKCDLQFDGRVPRHFAPTKFDSDNKIFDSKYVKGKGVIIKGLRPLEIRG